MSASTPERLLVVIDRMIVPPRLLDAVRRKAADGPMRVTVLVPAFPVALDPEGLQASHAVELAIPLLREVTGGYVDGVVGNPDPFLAIRLAVKRALYDEVIICWRFPPVARWAKRDLPRRVRRLGVEVTMVTPDAPAQQQRTT